MIAVWLYEAATSSQDFGQQIETVIVVAAAVVGGLAALWRMPTTRKLISRVFGSLSRGAIDWIDARIYQAIKRDTADIRKTVFPNREGSSLLDKCYRLEQSQIANSARIKELRDALNELQDKE